MSKKIIFALAMALVLAGGAFAGAQAQCDGCSYQWSTPSCWSCNTVPDRDFDRPNATCQGAYNYGPVAPEPFGGSIGIGGG